MSRRLPFALLLMLLFAVAPQAQARKVYRCVQAGTVSLSTAPEPGSRCVANEIDDNAARYPTCGARWA
jgi:hypothetical protein